MVEVFANGAGNQGSIPGRIAPNTQQMLLDAVLYNTQHFWYGLSLKWCNLGNEVAPSPTPRCRSY